MTARKIGHPSRPLADRLWGRVNKTQGCWLWTGQRLSSGYGHIALGGRDAGKALVHRLVYELEVGPIPEGLILDHICRTRLCCNPDHLQPVTNSHNLQNQSGAYRNSLTGVRGVSYDSRRSTYRVRVAVDGKRYQGGTFASLDEAEAAAVALRNRVMTNNLLDRQAEQK